MNYYSRFIGDYLKDTMHLTPAQDGFYNRLLDLYYSTEKPLDLDREKLYISVRANTEENRADVNTILLQFFKQTSKGYRNKKADEVIRDYKSVCSRNKKNGQKGGRPKTQSVNSGFRLGNPNETYPNPNPKPNINTKATSKDCAAKSAADPRHKEFVEYSAKSFVRRYGQKPSWMARHYAALRDLLKSRRDIDLLEFGRRWEHFMSSTEKFTSEKYGALDYFCQHFDAFINGPILERKSSNVRQDPEEFTRRNLEVAGLIDPAVAREAGGGFSSPIAQSADDFPVDSSSVQHRNRHSRPSVWQVDAGLATRFRS